MGDQQAKTSLYLYRYVILGYSSQLRKSEDDTPKSLFFENMQRRENVVKDGCREQDKAGVPFPQSGCKNFGRRADTEETSYIIFVFLLNMSNKFIAYK